MKLTRSIDQWTACSPRAMANEQSPAAIEFAFEAAKNDIITLYRELPAQAVRDYRSYEARFLAAWKRGVLIAGGEFFGEGSTDRAVIMNAPSKWELAPRIDFIGRQFGAKSSGERKLLAGMVSFYNRHDGAELCQRGELIGPWAFSESADDAVRLVIAELTLYYPGW